MRQEIIVFEKSSEECSIDRIHIREKNADRRLEVFVDHEDSKHYASIQVVYGPPGAHQIGGMFVADMTRKEYHEFVSKLLEFDELFDPHDVFYDI